MEYYENWVIIKSLPKNVESFKSIDGKHFVNKREGACIFRLPEFLPPYGDVFIFASFWNMKVEDVFKIWKQILRMARFTIYMGIMQKWKITSL